MIVILVVMVVVVVYYPPIFLYLPGYGGGSEATGAFFFLNTYGGFLRWRIWATYSFFSIQHAFIDFECFCAFLCKV